MCASSRTRQLDQSHRAVDDEVDPQRDVFSSLRVRNFRYYAIAQVLSLFGTWMQRIAQDWLVLEVSGGSPVALGTAVALQFVPMPVFTLWAGVLADRFDKRKLLILLQHGTGGAALVLGLLSTADIVQLWQVYVLCLALGCFSAMEMPIRQSFVTDMVGTRQVGNAVALNSIIFNSARIAGPAAAGLLIAWIGLGWLFLVNAASVIAVIFALMLMDPALINGGQHDHSGGRRSLIDGLRYVRARADLVLVLIMVFSLGTFGITFVTTIAVMARQEFGLGSRGFGLLHAMLALGTLTGAVLAARRSNTNFRRMRVLVASGLLFGFGEMLAAIMPWAPGFGAMLVLVGAAQMTFVLTANNTLQLSVTDSVRGRVMALYMLLLQGGAPLASTMSGWLAENVDARAPLLIGGAVSALAVASCGRVYVRMTR